MYNSTTLTELKDSFMTLASKHWAVVLFVSPDNLPPFRHKFLHLVKEDGAKILPCSNITADVTGNENFDSVTWAKNIIPGIGEFLGYCIPVPEKPTYDFTYTEGDTVHSVAVFLFEIETAEHESHKFTVERIQLYSTTPQTEPITEKRKLMLQIALDYYICKRNEILEGSEHEVVLAEK